MSTTTDLSSTPTTIKDAQGSPIPLAMQKVLVTGQVLPAGCILNIVHEFKCAITEPMEVIYAAMLPRDAVLQKFIIEGDGFKTESEIKPRDEARQIYEKGIEEGHLSALVETHVEGLTNLTVGQVRPGEAIKVTLVVIAAVEHLPTGYRFRYPLTVAPSYHPSMKVSVDPDGLNRIDLPNQDPGLVLPVWTTDPTCMHRVSVDLSVDTGTPIGGASLASPSHRIALTPGSDGSFRVEPSADGDMEAAPNRDLVLDVEVKNPEASVHGGSTDLPEPHWLAIIPPALAAKSLGVALDDKGIPTGVNARRRFCFVIDRSGSMSGPKMASAKKAVESILQALSCLDEFALLCFDDSVEVLPGGMQKATQQAIIKASMWLQQVGARGGTEILPALQKAGQVLNGAGDIMIITDGEVFDTGPIVEKVATLSIRVHCLGINSASQDRFLDALSKRTGGISTMVSSREATNIEKAALRIFNGARTPIAVNAKVLVNGKTIEVGTIWPSEPVRVFGSGEMPDSLKFEGGSSDIVFTRKNQAYPALPGLLWAARQITELEAKYDVASNESQPRIWEQLKDLSTKYQVASRAASLVAVVHREGDTAGVTPTQQVAPVGIPEDENPAAYGFNYANLGFRGKGIVGTRRLSLTRNYCANSGTNIKSTQGFMPDDTLLCCSHYSNSTSTAVDGYKSNQPYTLGEIMDYAPPVAAAAAPVYADPFLHKTDYKDIFAKVTMDNGYEGDVLKTLIIYLVALKDRNTYGVILRRARFYLSKQKNTLGPLEKALVEKALAMFQAGSWGVEAETLLGTIQAGLPVTWAEVSTILL